ncbi:ABC transporter permease [Arsenicicoccus sp. oral taxon 190]|uniref:ABC transporter permease n=1 Tax=Arsenicicoccus sp. oral taxon 190 TaxID=1658671 RepID=UPI00067A2C58|nr:ABC transporter permease subunit [Arsenicicoccus sp. oral taxon 190]AKT50641.1 hypothetical protein ADJ73_03755 [Arsenicicoccus sp. oral taxon 190]
MTRDGALTGTGLLARALLRRTRVFWTIWILALVSVFPATAAAYRTTVPTGPAGEEMARTLSGNPTMRAILGPPFDLLHVGPFVMWRVGTFMVTLAAIMAVLGTIRATRAEEEDGRLELIRSGAVGRHAPLAAAVVVGLGACALLGLVAGASMAGPSGDARGSVALGLGIALGAAVWVGVAAVAAQVVESARGARALALGAVGAAYGLRALGDGSEPAVPALQWLSPLDWPALARPYAGERWPVHLLPLAVTVVLLVAAFALEARRDHGAGLRAARLGPADASPRLRGAGSLAWRLDRTSVVTWCLGLLLFAYGMGTLAGGLGDLLRDNPEVAERFRRMGAGAQDLQDAFYVAMTGILVPIVALLGLQLVGVLRREEERGHAEQLLATATSRTRLLASHVVIAGTVVTVVMLGVGVAMALPQVLAGSGAGLVGSLVGGTAAQLPGILLVIALATAIHGWAPRLGVLAWVVVGWSLAMSWLGEVMGLPESLVRMTPFARLPRLPAEPLTWGPILVTLAVTVALLALGLVGYRRRDITPG